MSLRLRVPRPAGHFTRAPRTYHAAIALVVAFVAWAQCPTATAQGAPATAGASASGTVIRPISIRRAAELSFGRLAYAGRGQDGIVILPARPPSQRVAANVALLPNGGETAWVRHLVGEPNRAYRVTVPGFVMTNSGMLRVNQFTLWSSTRHDISASRLGSFNANGTDTLRLGGTLAVPKGTRQGIYDATVPVTIAYE